MEAEAEMLQCRTSSVLSCSGGINSLACGGGDSIDGNAARPRIARIQIYVFLIRLRIEETRGMDSFSMVYWRNC